MDIIFLQGLTIETVIGIYDWERGIRQTVILDLEMAADIRQSVESNDIRHTVDYNAVSRRIVQFVEDSQFELVETLAERVTELLREEFQIPWVRLRLNKRGAIRGATDVGILIERGAKPATP
jgi:dihydroneopterin aldolase